MSQSKSGISVILCKSGFREVLRAVFARERLQKKTQGKDSSRNAIPVLEKKISILGVLSQTLVRRRELLGSWGGLQGS